MAIIKPYKGKYPKIGNNVYISENASVVGDVKIGNNSSIWFGAVVRGDVCNIFIGENSNVQDNATIHVNHKVPAIIGNYVTIGHNAVIHAATIEDNVIIGMGAIVLDNSKIGKNSIIGAGTVVPQNTEIPPSSLVVGIPGKVIRQLTQKDIEGIIQNAMEYVELAKEMKNI